LSNGLKLYAFEAHYQSSTIRPAHCTAVAAMDSVFGLANVLANSRQFIPILAGQVGEAEGATEEGGVGKMD
jgi:hypothetical protein